jgi:hypothetical protein
MSDLVKFEEWLALAVEDIISHSSHAATLIIGSGETYLDCVILACWRRVQRWSTLNIIAEFRMHTWPHKLYDYEQLIERFNTSLVDIISLSPEFNVIHSNLQVCHKKQPFTDISYFIIYPSIFHRKRNTNWFNGIV